VIFFAPIFLSVKKKAKYFLTFFFSKKTRLEKSIFFTRVCREEKWVTIYFAIFFFASQKNRYKKNHPFYLVKIKWVKKKYYTYYKIKYVLFLYLGDVYIRLIFGLLKKILKKNWPYSIYA
jgi:hypothetical protein